MGFSVEYSGLIITHVWCRTALVLSSLRWLLCCAYRDLGMVLSNPFYHDLPPPTSSPSPVSSQMVRKSLQLAIFCEMARKLPECGKTCAVCLNDLRGRDKVWDLRNCHHVFHKRCLDRWLDHDEHKTCPLCRTPLLSLASSSQVALPRPEPSWAVERLLYLFGDDLLSF